ncbi:MAG: hypothetical protein J0I06_08505 [Planctomycetes bacterium]|nr:hypothetical protein [Planctomycetota bacterium]
MTNDAKLGMLVGVLGVIVAAVLFTSAPPPAPPQAGVPEPSAQPKAAPPAVATVVPPIARGEKEPLASTPVARTRRDASAQPVSRSGGADEEP